VYDVYKLFAYIHCVCVDYTTVVAVMCTSELVLIKRFKRNEWQKVVLHNFEF